MSARSLQPSGRCAAAGQGHHAFSSVVAAIRRGVQGALATRLRESSRRKVQPRCNRTVLSDASGRLTLHRRAATPAGLAASCSNRLDAAHISSGAASGAATSGAARRREPIYSQHRGRHLAAQGGGGAATKSLSGPRGGGRQSIWSQAASLGAVIGFRRVVWLWRSWPRRAAITLASGDACM